MPLHLPHAARERLSISRAWFGVAALAFALLTVATLVLNSFMFVSVSAVISPSEIQPEMGKAFHVPLPAQNGAVFESRFEGWDRALRRNVLLYEDGRLLGAVPAPLGKIRELGQGRYSQWGPAIIFSPSNNSDPRLNNRVYSVEFPIFVKSSVQWSLAGFTLALMMGWLWALGYEGIQRVVRIVREWMCLAMASDRAEGIANGATVLVIAGALWAVNRAILDATGSLPLLSPDSPSYVQWYLMRTPGYPLFLKGITALFHDARWIVPVQLNFLLGSIILMGGMIGRLFQSRLVGLAVILSCFCATPVLINTWFVMTEAVYSALLCLHVASVVYLVRAGSLLAGVMVGATIGAVVAVRPSGYSLLGGLPILLLCFRDRWQVISGSMVAGVGLVLLLTIAAQYQRHGLLSTQSFGGFSLAGYVAPLIKEDLHSEYSKIAGRVERRIHALVETLPDPSQAQAHALAYADVINPVMYRNLIPEMDAYLKEVEPNLNGPERWRRGDAIAGSMAVTGIIGNPTWYMAHCLATYKAYWRNFYQPFGKLSRYVAHDLQKSRVILQESGESFPGFEADRYGYIARNEDGIDRMVDAPTEWLDEAWSVLPYGKAIFIKGVFVFTVLAAFSVLWINVLPWSARIVAYLALLLQANIIFISLVVTVNYRMLTPLMPLLIAMAVGGCALFMSWVWWSVRMFVKQIQPFLPHFTKISAEGSNRT